MLHPYLSGSKPSGIVFCLTCLILSLLAPSCGKSEGPGGTASISGRVTEKYFNDDYSLLIHERPAVDEEVFIVYGDQGTLGNRVRTNHRGRFSFAWLYPGNYEVFILSGDSASALGLEEEKLWQVELGRGEDLELGDPRQGQGHRLCGHLGLAQPGG